MEFIIASVFFVIISTLTIFHFFIHKTRSGRLIDRIPGPRCLPVLGNALHVSVPVEDLWGVLRKCGKDYYPIYKLWIGHWAVVIIRHPDDAELLLSHRKNITKSLFYDFLHPWLQEGLLTSTGSKWRQRRKMLTPAFHFTLLHDFVGVFVETSQRMVNGLKEEGGVVVKDVVPFLARFSLDAICETAMGTTLEDDDLCPGNYRHSVKRMGDYFYYRAMRPWLKSDWLFSWTKVGARQVTDLEILHNFTKEIIAKRKRFHEETGGKYLKIFSSVDGTVPESSVSSSDIPLAKKKLAMLDLLIAVQNEQGIIDDRGICEEVDTFIFEGHDTTNISMSFAVLLLAENKEIQARARDEIDAVLKESNGQLGMVELQNMTYLECCVKEALRLYPAVPLISRNLTEDLQLKNFLLPPGTTAAVHVYDLQRDPNFWPHPEVFDPDRFLPERIAGRHPFSYIPFSAGPRNCIGQKYAMLELKAFIGLLLHNFYFESIVKTSAINMVPDLVLKPLCQKYAMLELKAFIGLILHNFYLEPMTETSSVFMLSDLVLKSQQPLNVKFIPIQ